MPSRLLITTCTCLLLAGCQEQSLPHPKSQKLSVDKVAEIASTIERKYPNLSIETRSKVLNTVVRSLDNMVFVEGGAFQMGDFGWPFDDDPHNLCEWPCGVHPSKIGRITMHGEDDFVHPVKLSSYSLSKFQTTIKDFDIFFISQSKPVFNAEDRKRKDIQFLHEPNHPAPTKEWQEAKDYCGWLGDLSGYQVDLPTEAQWEYAARNRGKHVVFPTDNGSLNYGRNFPEPKVKRVFPVDSFVANPLGIYNLSGNATDWVNDWYDKDYYRRSPVNNPQGPRTGRERIWRGANVLEDPLLSASTVRRWGVEPIQEDYYPSVGFRCAIQSEHPL
ncbi:formylglycine-generating enzyme family protein [Pseudomonas auratipiscis]|uniref:SUMF1/EgtB/PvdO family nonheme iron enzyme n=1 Tax=Pseudomonas auratipiscis TaxID=3115853 RepID=A0AB35WZA7_9PSED|nr:MULTISPECIES: SUMF1/EgtB/PvdO family nonheme iron enzyme [unclassified Pseudomonas]MEE1868431.1 SUMF1/EgtB/PvdO family nonheme iron enzyme [Pseudomonas sp. 120P]MEE1959751.1 SUMF1/EgtB/PvdO family nonheme iron enzyme [Pseudomonas sp. 119P]